MTSSAPRENRGSVHLWLALQLALRQLLRAPASPIYAALTLAIGLGAATAIYSVMKGFDAPLPVPQGQEVQRVELVDPESGRSELTSRDVLIWQEDSQTIDALGAFSRFSTSIAAENRQARIGAGAEVSPETFELLRLQPLLGRLPEDPLEQEVALVVSHRLWQSWLDADPQALGNSYRVGDQMRTLVAVMPEGFHFPFQEDLWVLRTPSAEPWAGLEVALRLKEGVGAAAASAELQRLLRRGRMESEGEPSTARLAVRGFTEGRGESSETTMLFGLLVMVMALVFVSCSNVSNLLLERTAARSRTLAAHQALGAHPAQVVSQVLIEALFIAFLGAALGVLVALGVVKFVEETLSGHWGYFWMQIEVQPSALLFAAALAIATAVISGMLPAWRVLHTNLAGVLQQESRSTHGAGKGWGSWLLITGQVAFSCLAVIASVLMGLGLIESSRVLEGFPADEVYWSNLSMDGERYDAAADRNRLSEGLVSALKREPAVRDGALSTGLPGLFSPTYRITRGGAPLEEDTERVLTTAVTPGYFDVFGLAIEEGRGFYDFEPETVAVVSRDFVDLQLNGEPAIGRTIDVHRRGGPMQARIVGVVEDLEIYSRDRTRDLDHVYLPLQSEDARSLYLTVRAEGEREGVAAAVGRALRSADAEVPLGEISSISSMLSYVRQFLETLGTLALLGGLGATIVVAIGLYGIISFDVRRRIPEFALRLALGAPVGRVLRGVLRKGILLVLPGMLIGLGLTYVLTPLLGIFLGGADSHDLRVFGGAVLVYLVIALVASVPPARRAALCNPGDVLRNE